MEAVEYLKAKTRMCIESERCKNCLLGVFKDGMCGEESNTEEAVEIVEKWAKENPPKTYLSVLLEKFPNAPLINNNQARVCPNTLFNTDKNGCPKNNKTMKTMSCVDCWNREYKEETNEI